MIGRRRLKWREAEIQLISGEETFASEARPELASMLPDIADGLAQKSHSTQDGELADLTEEAIALVEKYVPSSSRPKERLQDMEALIALTRREIARSERLATTVDEIVKLADAGQTAEAYELRRALLKEYPILLDDPELGNAVRGVSRAEQVAVEKVSKSVNAGYGGTGVESGFATVALAQRAVKSAVSGVGDHRIFAVAGGAVYGLEGSEGKVLWRRDIGFEKSVRGPQFPPTPVSERAGADPLLVSRTRQEVLRVESSTGKIRWRFPVGEVFDANPVVFSGQVLVATRSGRLLFLDLETGNSSEYLQLPQPLRVSPVADSSRNAIYQVGEHSSLFVLSAADGTCQSVVYLGHEPGSIIVPPVRVSRFLVICENDGVRDSVVKVLDLEPKPSGEDEGPPSVGVVQQVRLKGHVYTTPIVSGPQVLLVTDAGMISVFQLTGADGKDPLSLTAEGTTAGAEGADLVRYASLVSGRLWIADSQLTQYAVRSAERRLKPSWIADEGSVSLQPPIIAGKSVVHVRSRRGMPGVVVSAIGFQGETLWETTLASPSAGAPIVVGEAGPLIAATAVGGVFQMQPPTAGEVGLLDKATETVPSVELTAPIGQTVHVSTGVIALIPKEEPIDIPVFEAGTTPDGAKRRTIALAAPLSGEAIAFGGGLLAPTRGGQVLLLDPRTGAEIAAPFQPQLEAGRKYGWSRPASIDESQFVIADNGGGLHRVVLKSDAPKHLAGAVTVRMDDPITSRIAILGKHVYGVDRADSLVRVDLPGLTDKALQPLGAKCVMGPVTVGDRILLVTNDDLMHVIDSSGKIRVDRLPYGRPIGEPLVEGTNWLFATATGIVWRVDSATGEELAKEETGLALGSGLVQLGSRLIVAGHDGTLYVTSKP